MSKEQPEALQLPTLPFAVFDEFGQQCEDRVRDHFASAFEALRAQIWQGEPDGMVLVDRGALHMVINALRRDSEDGRTVRGEMADMLASAPPAPQQKPLTDEQINQMWSDAHNDTSTMSLIHVLVRAIEAAHNIGEKK